jgi:hypothetical protein
MKSLKFFTSFGNKFQFWNSIPARAQICRLVEIGLKAKK